MPLTQIALARSRGYALLADVAARGLTPESLAPLRAVRDLAPLLPEALDGPEQDNAAAEHYTVFGLNVFAYESVFLDPEARMGGAVAARAQESCARLGYAAAAGQEPDGLVAQLGCLAFLCGAEAEAREDHKVGAADRIRRKQAEFLGNHLLCWLPALSEALARQESRFYAALAPLITSLSIDHYADIAPLRAPVSLAAASADEATAAFVLDEAGVRAIVRRLLAPAQSGLFLARSDLVRLARSADLPTSFGERTQMLGDLLHGAGHFGRLPALLNALDSMAAQAEGAHAALEEETPAVAPFVAPWLARLDATRALLAAMRDALPSA